MNWLDLLIIVIIGIFTFGGLISGLVRQGLTLVGLMLGVYLATRYYGPVAKVLAPVVVDSNAAQVLGFLVVLVVAWVGVTLITMPLRKMADSIFLNWLDHLGGLVFGFLVGWVISAGLVVLLVRFPMLGLDRAPQDSAIASLYARYLPFFLRLLPSDFQGLTQVL